MEKKKIRFIMKIDVPAIAEETEEGIKITFDDVFDKLSKAKQLIVDELRWG